MKRGVDTLLDPTYVQGVCLRFNPIKSGPFTTVGANRGLISGSTYIEIFSPKKTGFSPIKNTFQNCFDFFLCSMQIFSADATIF